MIDKNMYVAKIAAASPLGLVVINFDIILDYLENSKKNIQNDKKFMFGIKKARDFLLELRASLNMEFAISQELFTLYTYVDRKLAKVIFNGDLNDLDESIKLLSHIKGGFDEIEQLEEDKTPIMENAEQIYSGFTYGRDMKPTDYVQVNINRGFKA